MSTTICIVPFNNPGPFHRVLSQLDWSYGLETIVIDNSNNAPKKKTIQTIAKQYKKKLNLKYYSGESSSLAAATNRAIRKATGDWFVYLCSNHAWIYSPKWLDKLIEPMKKSTAIMGGTISEEVATHIQGGVFICRTELIKRYPYDEIKYPFSFMDVDICQRLMKDGHKLLDIMDCFSVMADIPEKLHVEWTEKKVMAIAHTHLYNDPKFVEKYAKEFA